MDYNTLQIILDQCYKQGYEDGYKDCKEKAKEYINKIKGETKCDILVKNNTLNLKKK